MHAMHYVNKTTDLDIKGLYGQIVIPITHPMSWKPSVGTSSLIQKHKGTQFNNLKAIISVVQNCSVPMTTNFRNVSGTQNTGQTTCNLVWSFETVHDFSSKIIFLNIVSRAMTDILLALKA